MEKMMFTVPKFSSKDDPDLWLYRYTKASKMNKWNEETMLQYVDNCFNQSLQFWFMDQDFQNWNQFKTAFLEKFSKKVNIDKIISGILNIKMTPQESVNEYIDRYEKLRLKYNNQIRKNQIIVDKRNNGIIEEEKESKNKGNTTTTIASSDVEFVITPAGFLRYFIKGLYSKSMARFIKTEKPATLEEAYQSLREFYGSEGESSDSSSEEEGESESEDEFDEKNFKNKKSKSDSSSKKSSNSKESSKQDDMAELINGFKTMSLLIGELVSNASNNEVKEKRTKCWNCMDKDHYTRECTAPCKICQSTGHLHFQCPQNKRNKTEKSKITQGEAMIIEEVYLSEKRKKTETETPSLPYPKRNARILRLGKETPSIPVKKIAKEPATAINFKQNTDVQMAEARPSEKIHTPVKTVNTVMKSPRHPLVPNENVKETYPDDNKDKINVIVDRIINETVHQVSLNDLASLSPVARLKLKSLMTKPQANRVNRMLADVNNEKKIGTVLLSEESNLPKGKSAPRTFAEINGEKCEVILDGGCTSFIISLNMAKKLGIREAEPSDTAVMFGDGKLYQPIGLIKNLHIKLGNTDKIVSVNALCYDVGNQYDFIIGREGLHALGVGTDWATHFWYTRSDYGLSH